MAGLLHRLGTFSARRAWAVLIGWVLALGLALGGYFIGNGGLSESFDIPNTASGDVIEELEDKLPDFSGASGTVVFSTTDGSKFTDEQRDQISALADEAKDLPGVAGVVDPFDTEKQRADQAAELEDGQKKIADGRDQISAARDQIDSGQQQLDAGKEQLQQGQAQLDDAKQQAEAAGYPTAQLDQQQQQLDQQKAALDDQQKQLDEGRKELEAQSDDLEAQSTKADLGAELLGYSKEIRVVSKDESAALVNVTFDDPRLELSSETKDGVVTHFTDSAIPGVDAAVSSDISQGVPEILGVGEAIGVVFAGIVLVVVLSSLIAAAFPIVTAIAGVGVATLATLAFSSVVQMASVTPIMGVMLGLAVGIDYSLFIINRHRKQLRSGVGVRESIALANATSGTAVVFAGSTVIVALLALNITGIPFLGLMGTAGAVSVLIAVLMAITATPALLGLAGERVLGRRDRARRDRHNGADKPAPQPVTPMSTTRAVLTTVVSVAALLAIAIPALSMRLGLPAGDSEPRGSSAYQAYTTTEDKFGEGSTGPLLVTADLPAGLDEDEILQRQVDVAGALADQDDVVAVAPIAVSDDNRLAAFQVVPTEGPSSESTADLVHDVRALKPVDGDMQLGVSGQAAINIDISQGLADVLPTYLAVVVGLSFLIMVMVFRSLLVPLIATAGFVLSLFATYGVVTAVFQWGWGANLFSIPTAGPLLSFLPIILVGILFGLAMDYQLFLATGMREAYALGAPARLAVAQGVKSGRRVVIAAALIMIFVFSGFISSDSTMIKSFGLGLATGVLLDAFVVRMLLMPALMHLLGASAWWLPKWLDKIIPNVDVEGAAFQEANENHAV